MHALALGGRSSAQALKPRARVQNTGRSISTTFLRFHHICVQAVYGRSFGVVGETHSSSQFQIRRPRPVLSIQTDELQVCYQVMVVRTSSATLERY